jgi:hypothetical protein
MHEMCRLTPSCRSKEGLSHPVKSHYITAGGSQLRIKEGASHHAQRGKNAEVFLISMSGKYCADTVKCESPSLFLCIFKKDGTVALHVACLYV